MRVVYKTDLSFKDLIRLLLQNFRILFVAGDGKSSVGNHWTAFFFRRRYWQHRCYNSKIFIAVVLGSEIYVNAPYSGISGVFERKGINFTKSIAELSEEIETKIIKTEQRLKTLKY